mmetsp:Transcript_92752/g.184122  ORF Transcript_92752/g.184122 Transcript_92752/m.184122 type:complete len:140 (-) Transcript_92752:49-468(-)
MMDPRLGVSPWPVHHRISSACVHQITTLHAVGGVGFCCKLETHPEDGAFEAQNGSLDYNAAPVLGGAASHHMAKVYEYGCHGAVPVMATSLKPMEAKLHWGTWKPPWASCNWSQDWDLPKEVKQHERGPNKRNCRQQWW